MNKKNLDMLTARLQQLGFGPAVEMRLLSYCCFAPMQFEIMHHETIGDDHCSFVVHCVKGDQGLYDAIFYTATFRRFQPVPVEQVEMDQTMQEIDWVGLYKCRENVAPDSAAISQTMTIFELLQVVRELDVSAMIRFRHWAGTALEHMIPNLAALKSQHEIVQRFYLSPDQPPISFAEALRFLQSKWMERRVIAGRKLLLKNGERAEETGGAAAGARGGKLLTKRTRPNRKPGIYNK